ncbi:MAG TPA: GxxExxY protein [candidate division Zixibacteria bacterium]|nr:GxxExxY protein [candidate division Zixibacteria bacterium]
MRDQKLATRPSQIERELQARVMDVALEVHKNMGLGFGREEYSRALAHEFGLENIEYERDKITQLAYKDSVAGEYILDFVVEGAVVVAVQAGDHLTDMDESKLKSILKANRMKLGLIINFSKDILEIRTVER